MQALGGGLLLNWEAKRVGLLPFSCSHLVDPRQGM